MSVSCVCWVDHSAVFSPTNRQITPISSSFTIATASSAIQSIRITNEQFGGRSEGIEERNGFQQSSGGIYDFQLHDLMRQLGTDNVHLLRSTKNPLRKTTFKYIQDIRINVKSGMIFTGN